MTTISGQFVSSWLNLSEQVLYLGHIGHTCHLGPEVSLIGGHEAFLELKPFVCCFSYPATMYLLVFFSWWS